GTAVTWLVTCLLSFSWGSCSAVCSCGRTTAKRSRLARDDRPRLPPDAHPTRREKDDVEVPHRTRHPGSGKAVDLRAPDHLAAGVQNPRTPRAEDRVGAELRHRGPYLLCLHRV